MGNSLTRIMVENYIEKVLVSPGYVKLIFLKQRHEQLVPTQSHGCHVILSPQTHTNANQSVGFIPTAQQLQQKDILWPINVVQHHIQPNRMTQLLKISPLP